MKQIVTPKKAQCRKRLVSNNTRHRSIVSLRLQSFKFKSIYGTHPTDQLLLSDNEIINKEETHGERYCNSMRPWGCDQRVLRVYNTA